MGRGERSSTLPLMNVPGPGSYNVTKEIKPLVKPMKSDLPQHDETQIELIVKPENKSIPRSPKLPSKKKGANVTLTASEEKLGAL